MLADLAGGHADRTIGQRMREYTRPLVLIVDDFARYMKLLALAGSAVTLLFATEYLADQSRRMFEYAVLIVLATVGMLVLISAGDLITLYLGLELMSLALYVVVYAFVFGAGAYYLFKLVRAGPAVAKAPTEAIALKSANCIG